MKFLIVLSVAAIMACQVIAAPTEVVEAVRDEVPVAAPLEAPIENIIREQRSYGAPAPSYAPAPAYSAPPRLGPSKSYSYQSPAPTIPCGQALVFSCAPSVAQAPCAAAAPVYAAAPSYGGY